MVHGRDDLASAGAFFLWKNDKGDDIISDRFIFYINDMKNLYYIQEGEK